MMVSDKASLAFRLGVVLLIIVGFCLYAHFGLEWVTAEVVGAKLPAGCELFFFGEDAQPVFTIALGCPGRDLIRLWPWPVMDPWFEDWWDSNQGLIAFLVTGSK
jgi:hypothetical protein